MSDAMSLSFPAFALASPPTRIPRPTLTARQPTRPSFRPVWSSSRPAVMCDGPSDSAPDLPPASAPRAFPRPIPALVSWWKRISAQRAGQKAAALRNYGLAAVLAYGLFDAVTYSVSFLLSLRAYLAAGKTLTWNTLPQVLALMWGINNLSRPFRIAGALALAPVVDRRVVKPFGRFLAALRNRDSAS